MKRVLTTVCTVLLTATAVMAQDFVSKYMSENREDTLLHCISVSPKMMEEVMKTDAENEQQERMIEMMANLKSMQIVSASTNGDYYFGKAEEMMAQNVNRFEPFLAFNDSTENCRIMVRKREETIIELVMLSNRDDRFQVINFTGHMDDEFIDNLAKAMMPENEGHRD